MTDTAIQELKDKIEFLEDKLEDQKLKVQAIQNRLNGYRQVLEDYSLTEV